MGSAMLGSGAAAAALAFAGAGAAAAAGLGPLATAAAAALGGGAGAVLSARRAARAEAAAARVAAEEAPSRPAGGEAVLGSLPVGVLLIAPDGDEGQVVFVNPPAIEMLGRCPPVPFHASALRVPRLLESIEASVADAVPGQVEFTHARGGERHISAHLCPLGPETPPLSGGQRPSVLVMLQDFTRIRRAEELHRDFVANASHELKTPLSAISGLIETLQGHAKDDPAAAARFLTLMASQAERMRLLVNDLLSLNRIELNERIRPTEPQRLAHVIGEVAEAMTPIAEAAGATLSVALPEEDAEVRGSFEELSQMLRNLIDNAVKYGAATIRVSTMHDPDRPGMIAVSVGDDGPGIAREHLPRLTERFYRVSVSGSRARGGTGLGLAIVKHVVNRHRGQLEIDSRLGHGSRFTVWLPLVRPRGAS
jgi:two-component system phosphate regulon sensor histidine kinase PhoR